MGTVWVVLNKKLHPTELNFFKKPHSVTRETSWRTTKNCSLKEAETVPDPLKDRQVLYLNWLVFHRRLKREFKRDKR